MRASDRFGGSVPIGGTIRLVSLGANPVLVLGGQTFLRAGSLALASAYPRVPVASRWVGRLPIKRGFITSDAGLANYVAHDGNGTVLVGHQNGTAGNYSRSTDDALNFTVLNAVVGNVAPRFYTNGSGLWLACSPNAGTAYRRSTDNGANFLAPGTLPVTPSIVHVGASGKFYIANSGSYNLATAGGVIIAYSSLDLVNWTPIRVLITSPSTINNFTTYTICEGVGGSLLFAGANSTAAQAILGADPSSMSSFSATGNLNYGYSNGNIVGAAVDINTGKFYLSGATASSGNYYNIRSVLSPDSVAQTVSNGQAAAQYGIGFPVYKSGNSVEAYSSGNLGQGTGGPYIAANPDVASNELVFGDPVAPNMNTISPVLNGRMYGISSSFTIYSFPQSVGIASLDSMLSGTSTYVRVA